MVDSSAIGAFNFAIGTICAWLVPRLISRHRLYKRTLRRSPEWISTRVHEEGGLEKAEREMTNSMLIGVAVSLVIYIATAITLALCTRDIDNRTSYIIVGISKLVGAFFLFLLSHSAPQWLGVYSSIYSVGRRTSLGATLGALRYRARLHVIRSFFKVYPLMMPFFLGAKPATIPVSVVVGCSFGVAMCYAIDYGNRNIKNKRNMRKFALVVAFSFIVASALAFSYGCKYIQEVWGEVGSNGGVGLLEILSFVVWLVVGILLHVSVWRVSRNMRKSGVTPENMVKRPKTFFGSSVFVSRIFSVRSISKAILRPLSSRRLGTPENSKRNVPVGGHSIFEDEEKGNEELPPTEHMSVVQEGSTEVLSSVMNLDVEAEGLKSVAEEVAVANNMDSVDEEKEEGGLFVQKETKQPTKSKSLRGILQKISSVAHFNDHAAVSDDEDEDEEEEPEEEDWDANKCHLVNAVCCDLSCGVAGREKRFSDKCNNCCQWTAWALLMSASLFFVVLLIGAQRQEKQVRSLLPRVHHILYSTMNTGPVCTYNDNYNATTIRERVEATQRTFPTKDEAVLAGYMVLHCGACSACSNYPDLRQQWTTREMLGQVALTCAKKVLMGGGFDALRECTMEKTGFEYDCATCWAKDYECVKKNCLFISIRAFMINTVTNLQVGENDITPSTCEEAMCEATEITGYIGFVPCSGASRRRMDIKSSIERPLDQQCRNVDVPSWANFFGPSTGHGDYPEDWNATTLE